MMARLGAAAWPSSKGSLLLHEAQESSGPDRQRSECHKNGRGDAGEVNERGNLADRVDLVGAAPEATMHSLRAEELECVVDAGRLAVLRVFRRGHIEGVVHEERRHYRVCGLLLEYLVAEVWHPAVSPREGLVGEDGDGRRGGGDHSRDGVALLERDACAPVLHALGQAVVRALRHRETVDQVNHLARSALDRFERVFDEHLPAREKVGSHLQAE
mmetsp:Transcript_13681/g.34860  ORF Transcript_13681/g.34860 Transcript_13681/m.34860 type:complete len:215 (+) Transcript_13681:213-857(+)